VIRRRIASALLAGAVAVMVVGNLPGSPVGPVLHALTLDEAWDVFAPDPVSTQAELEAVVEFADGSEESWHPPRASPLFAVRTYHWDMWTRVAALGYPPVAEATARWALERGVSTRRRPVRVTLRRRWFGVPPPGSSAPRLWRESDIYVHDLGR
jgi:hypothetical protein